MAGRVPWRREQHHRAVTEHVVVALDDDGLAVPEGDVLLWTDIGLKALAEHVIAFHLLNDPRRARIIVGVTDMVAVQMGYSQVGNARRRVSDLGQLALQRLVDSVSSKSFRP